VPSLDNIYLSNLVLSSGNNMFMWGGCWLGHFNGLAWSLDCFTDLPPQQIILALDGSILQLNRRSIALQLVDWRAPAETARVYAEVLA